MLKIGTVKWQGKCSRHPLFDPSSDGPGAIKGGCPRCQDLQSIHETHQKVLRLMRSFAPPPDRRRAVGSVPELQQDLFGSV